MPRQDKQPERHGGLGRDPSPQEIQEELAFLRQKCNSLSIRGHYAECIKTIEENLKFFYTKERWPENFFSILRLYQKCYPSLNKDQSLEEHLSALLRKNGIPSVFASLLKQSDASITWSADYFRDLAIDYQEKKEFETALSYADIVIKTDPGSAGAYMVKGWIYEDMGRDDDAAAMYQQALEFNRSNRHALNSLSAYYAKKNPQQALEYIDKALEDNPGEASFHASKAAILQKTGDLGGAMAALDLAIENDPYNVDYPYQRGELYLAQGKTGSAIPQYRLAIALNEKHVPSLLRLVEFSQESQPELALTYINTVCTMEPENRSAALTKARLLRRTGENAAAIRQYKAVLELDPACHEAMAGLGALYLLDDKPDRALGYLSQAIALKADEPAYHTDKARAHQKLKQNAEAAEEYKTVTTLDKTSARAYGELGYLSMELNPKESVEYFSKAIQYAPENAYYHTAKGELLMQIPGQREKAMECLNQASLLDPGNAELHHKLGRLLEEAGNLASAVSHYKKAIGLDPDNAETYYRLARLTVDTQPEMALVYVNSAISRSVTRGDYYFLKGKILAYLGQNPQAMEEIRKSAASGENGAEALAELNQLLGGDSSRVALMYFNRAIELAPDNAAYLCARAHLLYGMGEKAKALDQYEKLLKKNPNQHEALFGMARVLADKGDKGALVYFDKAIAGAPAEAEYHAEKATFLARDEATWREAVETFTEAINLNNQAWPVILGKARVLDAHGETQAAMGEYRHVLLIYPKSIEASARMGELLCDLSPANALVYLDHAIELDNESFGSFAWRARIKHNLGDEDAAADMCREAIYRGGETAETYAFLATVLETAMPETALKCILLALEQEGGKAQFHFLCGRLYLHLGRYGEAAAAFRRTVELDGSLHEAREKLAETAYLTMVQCGDAPDVMELADAAHESRPACPGCAYLKALILYERDGDIVSALKFIDRSLEVAPDNLLYREKLVELLGKKHSFLRLAFEKRRLEKLRRKLNIPLEIPEPPPFDQEEPPQEEAQEDTGQAEPPASAAQDSTPDPEAQNVRGDENDGQ